MDEIIDGKLYFVYNADKVLKAVKVEIKESDVSNKNEYEQINISIESWSGTISAPKDLDAYQVKTA